MNQGALVGRITKDLNLQKTTTGVSFANFILAVKNPFKDQDDFIPLTVWRIEAENLVKYQKKGSLISCTTRLESNTSEKDGETKFHLNVTASNIHYLEKKGIR